MVVAVAAVVGEEEGVRATVNGAHDDEVSPGVLTTNRRYCHSHSGAFHPVTRRRPPAYLAASLRPPPHSPPVAATVEFSYPFGFANFFRNCPLDLIECAKNGDGQCWWPFVNTCHATTPRIP